jgi:hypothetical protein
MSAAPLTLSKQEAAAQNYRPLTNPYVLLEEQTMFDNVIADMRRGNIEFVLVSATDNPRAFGSRSLAQTVRQVMSAEKEKAARAKSGSLRGETRRLTSLAQIVKVLDLIKLEFLRRAHWSGDPTAKAKITEILNQWIR